MKISPMTQTGATVGVIEGTGTPPALKPRSLKMMTNATPGQPEVPPQETAAAEELSISDDNIDKSKEVVEETQPLSPQLAAIAKQRRALQQERQALDKEKADFTAQKTSHGDAVDIAKLKSDPLGVLLDAGVTYDQMTEAILARQSNGYNPEIKALQEKLKALEEGVDKKLTDRDAQAKQAALGEMQKEAVLISAQGEEFALVRETKSIPHVMKLIERTYDEKGEILDVKDALKLIEDELFQESLKLTKISKVQSQFAPQTPVLPPTQQQRQMKTLTNRDTAAVPMSRKARALAAFQGTLKK